MDNMVGEMTFDTNISLDLVFTILAILGAVWRMQHVLESRYDDLRKELKGEISNSNQELRAEIAKANQERKAENEALRRELKAENAEIREDIRRVEDKVDESNQRIARLEGIILAREGLVETIID
ncbi:MAG: hypothetical protein F4Y70_11550 [Chloroflexi bacterium]|nr:hypothetical protein [Chloroflexota bacterium]MCY3580957.1 hypothetical protein [Chloroflexota bacterium]MXX84078.1 hypothetical protein [Chloroflexota bacterium]